MSLAKVMAEAAPDDAEALRVGSRDLWRETLGIAFSFDPSTVGEELSIVEARELMFEVRVEMFHICCQRALLLTRRSMPFLS